VIVALNQITINSRTSDHVTYYDLLQEIEFFITIILFVDDRLQVLSEINVAYLIF